MYYVVYRRIDQSRIMFHKNARIKNIIQFYMRYTILVLFPFYGSSRMKTNHSKLTNQLITCYDSQAKHFHNTRWFHKRPELDHILPEIKMVVTSTENNNASLLDIGCWTGRIHERLRIEWVQISYTWVDISPWMIETASKNYPEASFEVNDMLWHLTQTDQQSVDCILWLASFHHLQTKQERIQALRAMYHTLNYWWTCILVNRSYSERFLKKYRKECILAVWKAILALWKTKRNDLLIPRKDPNWKSNNVVHHRYYHLFTLSELQDLITYTDFTLKEIVYISQSWKKSSNRKESRNSLLILKKQSRK